MTPATRVRSSPATARSTPASANGAGEAAEGAYLTATGAPPDVNPEFQAAFKAKYSTDPALYSPEASDGARAFLAGIAAGNVDKAKLAAFVTAYDEPGITKQIKFDATGEPSGSVVFYTLVEGGKLVSKGLIPACRARQRDPGPDRIVGSGSFHTCRPRRWEAA